MKVISAEYVKSFPNVKSIDLEPIPSVAFIGRSNVGKSSLINHLLNRKKLVKTSSTPGKTQLINYFLINNSFYFVDLPGYGFASVPVSVKNSWVKMINDYLVYSQGLQLIVQLVDIRHKPSKDDLELQSLVKKHNRPTLVVANKVDKVKKSQVKSLREGIRKNLELNSLPIVHSTLKKIGHVDIWREIEERLF